MLNRPAINSEALNAFDTLNWVLVTFQSNNPTGINRACLFMQLIVKNQISSMRVLIGCP